MERQEKINLNEVMLDAALPNRCRIRSDKRSKKPKSRPRWAKAFRKKLWEKMKFCYWCGVECVYDENGQSKNSASIEHVIPLSNGGSWDKNNLVLACRKCNNRR